MPKFRLSTMSDWGTIQPAMIPVPRLGVYENLCDYHIDLVYGNRSFQRIIEKGFHLDGASIPRWAWSTTSTPFHPRLQRGAITHDDGYQNNPWNLERREWDEIAYLTWREDYVNRYITRKMDIGLKLGGWYAWNKYRKNDKGKS